MKNYFFLLTFTFASQIAFAQQRNNNYGAGSMVAYPQQPRATQQSKPPQQMQNCFPRYSETTRTAPQHNANVNVDFGRVKGGYQYQGQQVTEKTQTCRPYCGQDLPTRTDKAECGATVKRVPVPARQRN